MRSALVIASKDLKQRLRDRSAWIIAIVVPFGLAFILSSTIGNIDDGGFLFDFAVVDEDGGELATAFVGLLEQLEIDGLVVLSRPATAQEARAATEDDEVSAAFVIPAGLSAAVVQGGGGEITVITNAEAPISGQVATSIASGFAAEVNAVQLSVATVAALSSDADLAGLQQRALATASPIVIENAAAADDETIGFDTFYAIGIAVFFVFFTVQFGVLSLIHERQDGTLIRLLAAPNPRWGILVGKVLAAFVLGVVSMVVLWLATSIIMGATWGNALGVIALIIASVVAGMGITALIATIARTAEQAGGWTSIVAVVLGLLGGTFFPISQASGALSTLSLLSPHRWMMEGFLDLAAGDGLLDILPALGAVLGFGLVTGAIGLARANSLVSLR